MSGAHKVEYLDGCHHADLEEVVNSRHILRVEGTNFCAAARFMGAVEMFGKGDARVCIMLALDEEDGLYIGLTPEGARNYAAALLKMAAMVDQQIADQASAAIEAARSKGRS
jgi:hypothetical protein